MIFELDFHSDETLYIQLCNQVIIGIARDVIHEGDDLPSVRQLADEIGINMHTVNKAYKVLASQGFIKVDRRTGAVVAISADRLRALAETEKDLRVLLAKASCMGLSKEEIHDLIDRIYEEYGGWD